MAAVAALQIVQCVRHFADDAPLPCGLRLQLCRRAEFLAPADQMGFRIRGMQVRYPVPEHRRHLEFCLAQHGLRTDGRETACRMHPGQHVPVMQVGVDQNVTGDPLVRLLVVPAYFLHTFWLEGDDGGKILVVHKPDQYTQLQYETLYTPREFLELLAQLPYVAGIPTPSPSP